jgi:hypothetical protein
MTFADAPSNGEAGAVLPGPYPMLHKRAPDTAGAPSWPSGFSCDTVAAPLDACCGVFDQLSRFDRPVPPIAQLGGALLFLVRPGSAATALACMSADCEALGIEIRNGSGHPGTTGAMPTIGSWVVPPSDDNSELPPASTVVAAIRVAYAATRQTEGTQ